MYRRIGLSPAMRDGRRAVLGALFAGVSIAVLFVPHLVGAQTISPTPGVVVDLGVLETLGQPQTVPDLLYPHEIPGSRLHIPSPREAMQSQIRPTRRAQVQPLRKPETVQAALPPSPSAATPAVPPPSIPAKPTPPVAQTPPPAPAAATVAADPEPTPAAQPPSVATPSTTAPPAAAPVATADPAEVIEAEAAPATVAAIPPQEPPSLSTTTSGPEEITIVFSEDDTAVPPNGSAQLGELADILIGDASVQVQVLAYAGGGKDTGSRARRISLSRALSVRSYLMDQGVTSTRIEVRALGNQVPSGNPDRVDIKLVRQ